MEEQTKRATNALQLLFVASIVAIVLTFVSGSVPWLNLIPVVLNLVGIWMLWVAIRSTKLKVSLITSVIYMVLEAISQVALGGETTMENVGAVLPVGIVSSLCAIVYQVCLFRGIADYMVQHGFPEAAGTGRTLSVLIIVINVLTIVTLGASAALLLSMGHTYVGGSITAILMLGLATVVVSIIYLVMRIFFFYNCRKKLLMTPRNTLTYLCEGGSIMEERKGKPIQAMQLLFVITIVAIPLAAVSLFVASWLNCIPALVVLIGAMMLYRSIGSKYLKVSAITGVIYVVLYIVSELIPVSNTETALGGQTVLTVVAIACGLVHQFTLLRGAADYMEGQGCPETAREGRTAAVLSVVGSIGSLVVAIVGVATLTTFSIILSLAAGFLALVLVVIGIIALFSRLSFFYRSMKRLKDGLQETPIQTQEKK